VLSKQLGYFTEDCGDVFEMVNKSCGNASSRLFSAAKQLTQYNAAQSQQSLTKHSKYSGFNTDYG